MQDSAAVMTAAQDQKLETRNPIAATATSHDKNHQPGAFLGPSRFVTMPLSESEFSEALDTGYRDRSNDITKNGRRLREIAEDRCR